MIKLCHYFLFIFYACFCFGQKPNTYHGVVLTKITNQHTARDTSRLLYCRSSTDDQLSVYTVANGVVAEANAYRFTQATNGIFLHRKPLIPGQQMMDSLRIDFEDKTNTVIINHTDRYRLYPAYYARFKQEVHVRHSVMAILNLLSDALGDYPILDALPLIRFTPQFDKRILRASIVTQRSQADVKDTWTCKYFYDKRSRLDSVSVISGDEMRFNKKVRYYGANIAEIRTYLNIESRQTTDLYLTYYTTNRSLLKWKERVYETGKDRETLMSVTLKLHDLGVMRKIEPSTAEVLELLKSKSTYENTKIHID